MYDIVHDFSISASCQRVFQAVSSASGLDSWWTKKSSGEPAEGKEYVLWFGAECDWRAVVSRCVAGAEFELRMTKAQEDWLDTRVCFLLEETNGMTQVRFQHLDWPEANDHYRGSSFCWAMYLRLLKQYVENNELVPYEARLNA